VQVVPHGDHDLDFPPTCAAGLLGSRTPTYQASAECEGPCPAGYLCATRGTVEAAACPPGHACPAGSAVALPCDAGTWSNASMLPSTSACSLCPVGHACQVGATAPKRCRPGTIASATRMALCDDCPAGSYQDEGGQTSCEPCPLGSYCPEGAATPIYCPGGTVGASVGLRARSDCALGPKGHWCTAGRAVACNLGFYQPFLGVDNETACLKCPEHATTSNAGATSAEDCVCVTGFVVAPGGRACVCDAGYGIASINGEDRCNLCERGKFKSRRGNAKCNDCPLSDSTTAAPGAVSSAECVCMQGTYLATLHSASPAPAGGNASTAASLSCLPCGGMGEPEGVNCTRIGVTLESFPVAPGYYRSVETARVVRQCPTSEACLGGDHVGRQCRHGQRGPLCAVCADGFYGGGSGNALCDECTGSAAFSIAVPVTLLLLLIAGSVCLLRFGQKLYERLLADSMEHVDVQKLDLSDEAMESAMEAAIGKLAKRKPRLMRAFRFAKRHAASLGVRFKILISLYQVLSGVGIVFKLPVPPLYRSIMNLLSFLNLNLPDMIPLGCLVPIDFISDLVMKTALPMIVYASLSLIAQVARLLGRSHRAFGGRFRSRRQAASAEHTSSSMSSFVANVCSAASFYLLYLVYPSVSASVFQFFVCETLDGEGETGTSYLAADYSIVCYGPRWNAMSLYAAVMVIVYPFGVPLWYAFLLVRERHDLDRLRRLQIERDDLHEVMQLQRVSVDQRKQRPAARRSVAATGSEDWKQQMQTNCEAELRRIAAKTKVIKRRLPVAVKKLTDGYEHRAYWFEVLECVRKIMLVGLPVVFRPGSSEQRFLGLLICFFTAAAYAFFTPYEEVSDDILACVCQLDVFLLLNAAIVFDSHLRATRLDIALTVMLLAPIALVILFELGTFTLLHGYHTKRDGTPGPLGKCTAAVSTRFLRLVDAVPGAGRVAAAPGHWNLPPPKPKPSRRGSPTGAERGGEDDEEEEPRDGIVADDGQEEGEDRVAALADLGILGVRSLQSRAVPQPGSDATLEARGRTSCEAAASSSRSSFFSLSARFSASALGGRFSEQQSGGRGAGRDRRSHLATDDEIFGGACASASPTATRDGVECTFRESPPSSRRQLGGQASSGQGKARGRAAPRELGTLRQGMASLSAAAEGKARPGAAAKGKAATAQARDITAVASGSVEPLSAHTLTAVQDSGEAVSYLSLARTPSPPQLAPAHTDADAVADEAGSALPDPAALPAPGRNESEVDGHGDAPQPEPALETLRHSLGSLAARLSQFGGQLTADSNFEPSPRGTHSETSDGSSGARSNLSARPANEQRQGAEANDLAA
jgi:hypothetical protein